MALTVNKSIIKRQQEKDDLIYWQITSGSSELWRQDEKLSPAESFEELENAIDELSENARPGDAISISMQNMPASSSGRVKGIKMRKYQYTLVQQAGRGVGSVGGNSSDYMRLVDKLARMEEAERWRIEKEALNKRLEALEEEKTSGLTLAGISTLLAHPTAQMALAGLFGMPVPAPGAPVNGPEPDQSQEDVTYLVHNDPNFKKLLRAVRLIHQHDPGTYTMSSNMIIETAKKYQ
ncbi:MAG: hypothetical protein [Bacteriophage sp.]|nr:MAG: hypothetical protein [Bacteriophage sp.]